MRRFILRGMIFLGILWSFLFAVDYVASTGLKNTQDDIYKEWNDIVKSNINSDIIIQGSSRAWVHISPKIIEDDTKYSCYNLGLDGYYFDMQLARYKLYRKYNSKPKMIIQSVDSFSLTRRENLYRDEQFLPYFSEKEVRNALKPYGYYNWLDYNIPLVRYVKNKDKLKQGFENFFHPKAPSSSKYKGYQGMNLTWDGSFDKFKDANPDGLTQKIDNSIVDEFDKFISNCESENIEVVLVYTPEYYEYQSLVNNREEIIQTYKKLADKHKIKFYDYSTSELSNNKENFYNSQHLNKTGSEIFTKLLVKDVFSNK